VSILPGIQAAFVDIGLGKAAFLHASDVDPSLLLEDDAAVERYTDQDRNKRKRIVRIPIEKVLEEGQEILVQVLKEPMGTKGAKVTTQISLAGMFLVLVPDENFIGVSKKTNDDKKRQRLKKLIASLKPAGVGFIVRTIGLKVEEEEFIKEIQGLCASWRKAQDEALCGSAPKLVHREMGITTRVIRDLYTDDVTEVYVDQEDDFAEIQAYLKTMSASNRGQRVVLYKDKPPLFDKYNIEKDLELSLKRKVWLKSGGYILFDHTEALLAIDVNTGRNVGRSNLDETIFRTNMEAAHEITRQFRLRDIGGIIVVDFIDMDRADHRKKIEDEMRMLLNKDPTVSASTTLSKFGLMEITRKRVRPELQELYTDVCTVCNGLGWVFSPATVTARIDRWLNRADSKDTPRELVLSVNPAVKDFLTRENSQMLKKMEVEHNFKLTVTEDDDIDQDDYEFYPKGAKKAITAKFT
jgi:ribonuclease G